MTQNYDARAGVGYSFSGHGQGHVPGLTLEQRSCGLWHDGTEVLAAASCLDLGKRVRSQMGHGMRHLGFPTTFTLYVLGLHSLFFFFWPRELAVKPLSSLLFLSLN